MMKPNFLIIMADQMRADYMGHTGHATVRTPNIDVLAKKGVSFNRAYCASAQCAPSRTSFVTGKYPHTHGVMFNFIEMPSCHKTMGHYFTKAGYRTAWIGKGHNEPPRVDYGFHTVKLTDCGSLAIWEDDYFLWLHEQGVDNTAIQKLWDDVWNAHKRPYDRYVLRPKYLSPVPEEQVMERWITLETQEFIKESVKEGRPFCAFASHHAPHAPYDLPEPYYSMYDPADVPPPVNGTHDERRAQIVASYMGKISLFDNEVGLLVESLKEEGVLDNTVIIVTSDHGFLFGENGYNAKMWQYEPDARIPMIISYPEKLLSGLASDALISNIDILPTMLELAGEPVPEDIQGITQLPVLTGESSSVRDLAFCETGLAGVQRKAVWHEDWKLIYRSGVNKMELYNLKDDPHECNDLSDDPEHQSKRHQLVELMLKEYATTEVFPNPMPPAHNLHNSGLYNRM